MNYVLRMAHDFVVTVHRIDNSFTTAIQGQHATLILGIAQ